MPEPEAEPPLFEFELGVAVRVLYAPAPGVAIRVLYTPTPGVAYPLFGFGFEFGVAILVLYEPTPGVAPQVLDRGGGPGYWLLDTVPLGVLISVLYRGGGFWLFPYRL